MLAALATNLVAQNSQLWPKLINTSNQQRNTKWPTHHSFFIMHTLSKPQREVTHSLGSALHFDFLIIGKTVVLSGNPGMVNHGSGVGC